MRLTRGVMTPGSVPAGSRTGGARRPHWFATISLGFASAYLAARLVLAQEAPIPPARTRRPDDRAWAAARREAEAQKKETEANFARLRGLPAAQPAEILARQFVMVQGEVVVQMGRQVQDRGGPDPDAPFEEEPPPPRFVAEEGLVDDVVFMSRRQDWILARFEALLISEVEKADREWGLTSTQEEKVRLAGRGDMKRFIDRVEEKRREFSLVRTDPEKCQRLVRELLPLRHTITSGPFGEGSIFSKVLKKIIEERRPSKRQPD